jgi:hypothetical protein
MAHLTLRRSPLEHLEPLSVVALAITYAVLSIALAAEWGRIVRVFATDVAPSGSDAASALQAQSFGDVP